MWRPPTPRSWRGWRDSRWRCSGRLVPRCEREQQSRNEQVHGLRGEARIALAKHFSALSDRQTPLRKQKIAFEEVHGHHRDQIIHFEEVHGRCEDVLGPLAKVILPLAQVISAPLEESVRFRERKNPSKRAMAISK